MPKFVACKLPHGLTIDFEDKRLTLLGANIGEDLENVSKNGRPNDNPRRIAGFGITELTDNATDFFVKWKNAVTFVNGAPSKGKLPNPFPAFENGAILGPFDSVDDLRQEVQPLSSAVQTGFEGLDPEAEAKKPGGVEPDADAGKGA